MQLFLVICTLINFSILFYILILAKSITLRSFIAVFSSKLSVKLTGEIKDYMNHLEGVYLLQPNQINGKSHWIIEDGSLAIWYDKEDGKEAWNIGDIDDLGSQTIAMYSSGDSCKPACEHIAAARPSQQKHKTYGTFMP